MEAKWTEVGFEEWRASGFESDYVEINNKERTIKPAFDLQSIRDRGFMPAGTRAEFLNRNGYDGERERAANVFTGDKPIIVKTCRIGNSSSNYTFEGFEGSWSTVMFGPAPGKQAG